MTSRKIVLTRYFPEKILIVLLMIVHTGYTLAEPPN